MNSKRGKMAIWDKLKFWKKKDEFPTLPDLGAATPLPEEEKFGRGFEMPDHPAFGQQQSFGQFQQMQYPQQQVRDKDLEIISAKLDAIKANVESISQRIERLERLAMQ